MMLSCDGNPGNSPQQALKVYASRRRLHKTLPKRIISDSKKQPFRVSFTDEAAEVLLPFLNFSLQSLPFRPFISYVLLVL